MSAHDSELEAKLQKLLARLEDAGYPLALDPPNVSEQVPPPMRAATANARLHPPVIRHRRRRRIPAIVALALPYVILAAIIVGAFLTINHAAS